MAIDRNAELYYQSANALLLPVEKIDEIEGFAVTLAKKQYFFRGGETPFNDSSSVTIVSNKYIMNRMLALGGIPVPRATIIHISELDELDESIAGFKFPLVAKPTINSRQGRAVLCNIQNITQLRNYLERSLCEFITIEEFHAHLNSYRVLVFNRRILGVIQRFPAEITGDGNHTIAQLIELTNKYRLQLNDALGKITADEECSMRLQELQIGLDYIPSVGERICLGYTSNASRGGSFVALNKRICKSNKQLMIRVAKVLNLNLVGIDVECSDINVPIVQSKGVIIEANNCPSIKIHENPMSGPRHYVSKKIIRNLIFRHPLSYFSMLYTKRKPFFYIINIILVILLGFVLLEIDF